jgi:hypothetical protein
MQRMQVDQIRRQQQEQEQQRQRQTALEGAYRGALESPAQQALAGGGGPTAANAQAMQGMAPRLNQQKLIEQLMAVDPMLAAQMLTPKPADYKVVGDSLVSIGGDGVKEAYRAPAKAEALPSSVREYQFAQSQGYKGTFEQFQTAQKRAGATSVSVNTGDRIPTTLVKAQDEMLDKINISRSTDADLSALQSQIQAGRLKFGPVRNLVNTGKNIAGISDEESRSFGTFKSTLEKLRNDSLRLNAGVQTDGDAQRAWNELFQNINDTAFVNQRMTEIRRINQRAAQLHEARLGVLRANSGAGPLPLPGISPAIEPAPEGNNIDSLVNKYRSK